MDLHVVMLYHHHHHHHHNHQHHNICNGITVKVAYTVGERVFAMDLETWNTEDLGPVILMADDNHTYDDIDNCDHDNGIMISILFAQQHGRIH